MTLYYLDMSNLRNAVIIWLNATFRIYPLFCFPE